jgi:hypothetical protein
MDTFSYPSFFKPLANSTISGCRSVIFALDLSITLQTEVEIETYVPWKNLPSSSLFPSLSFGKAFPRNTSGMKILVGELPSRWAARVSSPYHQLLPHCGTEAHLESSIPVTQRRPRQETCSLPEPKNIIDYHYSMFAIRSDLSIRSSEYCCTYGIDFIETASGFDDTFGLVSARGRDGMGYIWL